MIETYEQALAYLNAHIGHGVKPGLERITGLLDLMGRPDREYPIVHVAGTNGKTTTVGMVCDLLGAHGLAVGTFTSPHLQAIEERFTLGGGAVSPEVFVQAVQDVAPFVDLFEESFAEPVTYFELTAATAFALFAAAAVDVAVVEVGLGGRLDATNVMESEVAVITGISLDHTAWLGGTLAEIAAEKVAILDEGGIVVTGLLPAAAEGPVTARVAETGARWLASGRDFSLTDVRQAVGGWVADVEGVYGTYEEVLIPLHGRHQVDHFVTAVAATEAFFGRALDDEAVHEAGAGARSPGRLEVVGRRPLVLIDGAHNVESFTGLATTLTDEFPEFDWVAVIGIRGDREVAELITPLSGLVSTVIATAPADPAAVSPDVVAGAARETIENAAVETVPGVAAALARAIEIAGADGAVVTAGSLYVAGEARALFEISDDTEAIHRHIEAPVSFGDEEGDGEPPEVWLYEDDG